jgi:hypothetical protein
MTEHDDLFDQGFRIALELTHRGLMGMPDPSVPVRELINILQQLRKSRFALSQVIAELENVIDQSIGARS